MSANIAIAPDNMSYVNAFRALWENSKPASFFKLHPEALGPHEATVSTSEKVAEMFAYQLYIDYAGGRLIKTDFKNFPKLTVHEYDRNYGTGAAQKALDNYNTLPSKTRFDANDRYRFSDLKEKRIVSRL